MIQGDYVIETSVGFWVGTAYYGFKQWSDGVPQRKRTVSLTSLTTLMAIYELATVPQTSIFRIEQGLDDAMVIHSRFDSTGAYLQFNLPCWLRYALLLAPKAKILSAQLIGYGNWNRIDVVERGPLQIQHSDEDDALEFVVDPGRPVSGPIVEWLVPAPWWKGIEYSADVTSIIQDFVNRLGYKEANHIALKLLAVGPIDAQQFISYEQDPTKACRLEVIWELPVGVHVLKVQSAPITGVPVKVDGINIGDTSITKTYAEGE
ncbi:unnamed protein product, partial [marine sediment metagenome]